MIDFSALLCEPRFSEEEIAKWLRIQRYSPSATRLFTALLVGSPGNGTTMKAYHKDGDSPTFAFLERSDYEKAVRIAIESSNLTPEQQRLACDVAHLAYHWGYKNESGEKSEAIRHFSELLEIIKERSDEPKIVHEMLQD